MFPAMEWAGRVLLMFNDLQSDARQVYRLLLLLLLSGATTMSLAREAAAFLTKLQVRSAFGR